MQDLLMSIVGKQSQVVLQLVAMLAHAGWIFGIRLTRTCSHIKRIDWQRTSVWIARGALCIGAPSIRHTSLIRRNSAQEPHEMAAGMELEFLVANVNQNDRADRVVDDLFSVVSRWS